MSRVFAWASFGALALIAAAYLAIEGAPSLQAGYFSQYVSDAPETPLYRLFSSTKFFGVLAIILLFEAARSPRERVLASIASAGLIFLHLLFGSRSMPFLYALTVVACFDHYVRRVPLWWLMVLAVGGSAASFIVDQTRELGIGLQIFDFRQTGLSVNLFQVFWDAGSVVKTVLRTMAFAAHDGLLYGQSFVDAAVSMIPTPLLTTFGISREILRPSIWLVENSSDVPPGGGLGYSLVAESYLNFGMFGFVLFCVVGWFLARAYRTGARDRRTLAHVNALNLAVLLTLHMRNDVATYLRIVLWGLLVVAILRARTATALGTYHTTSVNDEPTTFDAFGLPGLRGPVRGDSHQ